MGVTDTVRDTAGSVAGAGAQILIEAGHAAGAVLKSTWTAPPMKIPIGFKVKKGVKQIEYIEIPPALVMAGVGMFGIYVMARQRGINPFDWLWTKIEETKVQGQGTLIGPLVGFKPTYVVPLSAVIIPYDQKDGIRFEASGLESLEAALAWINESMMMSYKDDTWKVTDSTGKVIKTGKF